MRLGFYHHIPLQSFENKLYIIGHMGRFLDGLASYCDELVLFLHPSDNPEIHYNYDLKSSNIRWVNLGPPHSAPYRTLFGSEYRKKVEKHLEDLDAFLIRGPTPLLPALAKLGSSLPVALLLGGDYLAGVESLPQPGWRKELIRIWAIYYNHCQLDAAKKCLTFVNSHKLFSEMRADLDNLIETKTTTLSKDDFYWRKDTCNSMPIHILYTGRMDPAKGLMDILTAVYRLHTLGIEVALDLVGKEDEGSTIVDELFIKADEFHLSEFINFHGFKPLGPELFTYYKNGDIYVIASQSSEGFPRTIWEAMAHSLPVVATKVGSIPYFLTNEENALLVEPNNIADLVGAIQRIIMDGELRRRLIRNAYQVPKSNTIEIRSKEMIQSIMNYIEFKYNH